MMIGFMDCIKLNEWLLDDHRCSGFGDMTPPLPTDDDAPVKFDPYGGACTKGDFSGLSPISSPSSDPGSHSFGVSTVSVATNTFNQ